MDYPQIIIDAQDSFSNLPGIGKRTALRHVMNLLETTPIKRLEFINALKELENLNECEECGLYSDFELCALCGDEERAMEGSICVVENISDCLAIIQSRKYSGMMHVLRGVLNPLMGIGPEELRLDKLLSRIKKNNTKLIILALNPSVEGDATCSYLRSVISKDVEVERIGFGVPIGGSLEFLDPLTISKALENRQRFI